MKKTILSTLLILTGLLLLAGTASAALGIDPSLRPDYAPQTSAELNPSENPGDSFSTSAVTQIIGDFAVVLLQIAGVLAVYFIITNGLHYIKSFGQDEEVQKAKKGLIWAIAGLVIIITSYAIVQNILKILLTLDESAL